MATLIGARHDQAIWRDYLELTKPKVVVLMLITSLVGMFLATRAGVPWTVLIFGNLGIALCAGGAAAAARAGRADGARLTGEEAGMAEVMSGELPGEADRRSKKLAAWRPTGIKTGVGAPSAYQLRMAAARQRR